MKDSVSLIPRCIVVAVGAMLVCKTPIHLCIVYTEEQRLFDSANMNSIALC